MTSLILKSDVITDFFTQYDILYISKYLQKGEKVIKKGQNKY